MTAPETTFRVIQGGADGVDDERRAVNVEADLMAEVAVLGNLMADPSMLDAIGFLRPEHVHSEAHRRMYEACVALRAADVPIDVVAVCTWLRDRDRLAQVGGVAYVTEVLAVAPACSTAQTIAHARHVRDRYVRRQLAAEVQRTNARCDAGPEGVEELIAAHRDRLEALAELLHESEASAHVGDVMATVFRDLQPVDPDSIKARPRSGFDRIDRLTAGLPTQLRILAARPGMGKTSLATSMAVNVAKQGAGAFVATMETDRAGLLKRVLCAEAGVSAHRMNTSALSPADWQKLAHAAANLAPLPLWFDDDGALTALSLWAKCRRTKLHLAGEGRRLGLVVVDYLQLLRAPRPGMRREEVVAENTRTLRAMALDLGCCVLALAQLNRQCEGRPDKRPQLADLRESGEIEQAARCVLSLYREDYYSGTKGGRTLTHDAEVAVRKQSDGPSGQTVSLRFDGECLRFSNIEDGQC